MTNMYIIYGLLFLLFANGANGIVNGIVARENHQFSYAALVLTSKEKICSGSIIGPSHILTAAQCVSKVPVTKVAVLVGHTDVHSSEAVFKKLAQIIIHPNYIFRLDAGIDYNVAENDIAILKLVGSLTWGPTIQRISLPDRQNIECRCCNCYVAGWGENSRYLTWTTVRAMERETCLAMEYLLNYQSCAADPQLLSEVGEGDIGAGLVCNDQLIGMITHRGLSSTTMIYLAIYPHLEFIRDAISDRL